MTWAELVLALGIGGAVGALASAVLAVGRIASGVSAFDEALRAHLSGRTDPPSLMLLDRWERLATDVRALVLSMNRLRPRRR